MGAAGANAGQVAAYPSGEPGKAQEKSNKAGVDIAGVREFFPGPIQGLYKKRFGKAQGEVAECMLVSPRGVLNTDPMGLPGCV